MDDLPDLSAQGLLARAASSVRARRLAEVDDLEVLSQWAALHSGEPTRRYDVLVRLGGDGTPEVQELCLGEIAMARGTGPVATTNALADVLDLQHRLPLTWAVCRSGEAEVYIARRVAKLSRGLPADRVGVVDRAVARIIARESGGRVLAVAEAKIIEADPARHEEQVEAELRRRYVTSSRTDEHGFRTVIARVEAGDAVWVEATVARVAEILAPRHPDATADEVRAIAFGWLARPAELLALLLEHRDPQDELVPDESRATAFPADLLDALRTADLSPLAPRATLYVHLHEAAVQGADASPASRASARSRWPPSSGSSSARASPSSRSSTSPTGSAPPPTSTPGPSRSASTSSPAATTGPTPPRPHAASTTTIRSRTTLSRTSGAGHRARPGPTTPAPSLDDSTAGRPTPATAPVSAAPAGTPG